MNSEFMDAVLSEVAFEEAKAAVFAPLFGSKLSRVQEEDRLKMTLASEMEAQREVKTPAGYVDLVSEKLGVIAEVKAVANWKHALGQILVYAHYFPGKTPFIILFGNASDKRREMIRLHAQRLGVAVLFISGLSENLKALMKMEKKYGWDKLGVSVRCDDCCQSSMDFSGKERGHE